MEKWSILGISPTKDEEAIREAYMNQLNIYHPEENPEGFQKLRAAYEAAMQEAQEDEENVEDDSEVGRWMKKVEACYSDFRTRMDEEKWRELMQEDICMSLDTAAEASEKLLVFLMDYYRLPKKIWVIFDEQFDWKDKVEELKQKFPPDFIKFVINNIEYDNIIDYDLVEICDEGIDGELPNIDLWFEQLYRMRRALGNGDTKEAADALNELKKCPYNHPEIGIMEARYYKQIKQDEKAEEIAHELLKRYPDNINVNYFISCIEVETEQIEEAKTCIDKVLEIQPRHVGARLNLMTYQLKTGQIKEAEDLIYNILEENPYDAYVNIRFEEAMPQFVEYYKKESEKEQENHKVLFRLAWCYFNIGDTKSCKQTLAKINPDEEDMPQYYDVLVRCYSKEENYEKALEYIEKWLSLEPESKLDYIYEQQGMCYQFEGHFEEAVECYERSLEYGQSAMVYNRKAFCLKKLGRYEEAVEACKAGLELDKDLVPLYINLSEAYLHLGELGAAMEQCEEALFYDNYYVNAYEVQMKIYWQARQYERALEVAQHVEDMGIHDEIIQYQKARALEGMGKESEAEKLYLEVVKENPEHGDALYDAAFLLGKRGSYEESLKYINRSIKVKPEGYKYIIKGLAYKNLEKYEEALKAYDEGLKMAPEDDRLYYNKGLILEKIKHYDQAIENYKKALEYNPNHASANNCIGEIYDSEGKHEEALSYFNRQLQIREHEYNYICRAWCYLEMGRYEEAKADFEKASQMNPENGYAINGLGAIEQRKKKYKEAIPYFEKAVQIQKECFIAYENLIKCYNKLCDDEKVIEWSSKYIEVNKDCPATYVNQGIAYKNLKKYEEAKASYLEAIRLDPDYSWPHNTLGNVYRIEGEYKRAIEEYIKAITNDDFDYEVAYENALDTYIENLKDYKAAIKFFKEYIHYNLKGYMYRFLGKAYRENGNKIRAKMAYKKAIELYLKEIKKDDPCLCCDIGECYKEIEDYKQAIIYYKKAIELEKGCIGCDREDCRCAYIELMKIYETQGDWETAKRLCEEAMQYDADQEDYKKEWEKIKQKLK